MEAVAPGRRLAGRYVLEHLIATGGMAAVWRARDEVLARKVSVKILRQDLADDPSFAERFQREAVAAASLAHPNIISVFDTGQEEGLRYIVMEHFEGESLGDLMAREGPLQHRRAVDLVTPVLSALAFAHEGGLIHRDVKPANILIGDGTIKVTDFGIAKAAFAARELTTTGALIGTARYLSPEQVQGGEVDGRSDVYSVGVVLFEMLTGRPPFEAQTDLATAMMRLTREPPEPGAIRPGIPAGVQRSVLKALARDPGQRYPSARAMLAALDRHASAGSGAPTRVGARVMTRSPASGHGSAFRSWMLVPLLVVLLGVIVVIGGLAVGRLEIGGPLGVRPAPEDGVEGDSLEELPILGARDFDPQGDDGSEHPQEVALAVDGSRSTAWGTDHYSSADFGRLKEGLGLWVDLRGNPPVGRITVLSPIDGWTFQLQAGTVPDGLSDALAAADGSTTFEVRAGRAVIDIQPVRAPGILIWITGLGPDGGGWAAAVAEVRVMAAGT
jgi:tRNA A-37 threonylcarbamoyl transferase component Bud32